MMNIILLFWIVQELALNAGGDASPLSAKFKVHGLDTIRAGEMTFLNCFLEGTDTGAVTSPTSYVWVKDGKVIPGQTESVIRFPSATRQDAGFYQCGVPGSDVSGEGRHLHVVDQSHWMTVMFNWMTAAFTLVGLVVVIFIVVTLVIVLHLKQHFKRPGHLRRYLARFLAAAGRERLLQLTHRCISTLIKMVTGNSGVHAGGAMGLRLVLIGKTGAGKSATANTILNKDVFSSEAKASSVTAKCQLERGSRWGRRMQVVDTPGLFDTGLTQDQVADEIRKCVAMTAPGPHAIILVTAIGRFTKEESETVDFFRQMFGEEMTKYLVLLFTGRDNLDYNRRTMEDYLARCPGTLSSLLQLCGHRYVSFNNRAPHGDKATQVRQLLQVVDRLVNDNGGDCYTSEVFEKAEEIMREREEELRTQHDEQMNELRERVEKLRATEEQLRQDYEKKLQGKMAVLQSRQGAGEGKERRLKQELEDLRQRLENLQKDMRRQMEPLEMMMSQDPPDFRQKVQDEVAEGLGPIMSMLKKALFSFIEVVLEKVAGQIVLGVQHLFENGAQTLWE